MRDERLPRGGAGGVGVVVPKVASVDDDDGGGGDRRVLGGRLAVLNGKAA